jgi:deoxyribodipyrimidine photo-lyase
VQSVDAFLEELIVRGGLAENYCHYQPNYDNLKGAWGWAQESLRIHAKDKREWVYT